MTFSPLSTLWTLCLCTALLAPAYAEDTDQSDHKDGEAGSALVLSPADRQKAGILTKPVGLHQLEDTLKMPAEVVVNAYQSARVTPRVTAQVVKRHVRLGDAVEMGQSLVTLSSVDMAEAQGGLIVADREWQRVKTLGRQAVSERRYTEAQVARQQARAKVLAYGMTEEQAAGLLGLGDASAASGEFDLLAPISGTVLRDDFVLGELIEPGRVLFDISDESTLWVEAKAVPSDMPDIEVGANARVRLAGGAWFPGRLIQRHHQFDETTRTQGLRIEIDNRDDRLHPGQFVEVEIVNGSSKPTLAIPSKAMTLIDGLPTVFKLEDGDEFHAESVEVGPTIGEWIVVQAGISEGEEIAVDGIFYLKSLLLKSSLGEGHAH
jgi:membrane fusion protein, heavy metal efflux system